MYLFVVCLCSRARARAAVGSSTTSPPPRAVLVGLYEEPERPPNAVDYIKRYMGAPTGIDVEALRQENENVRRAAPRVDSFSPLPCLPVSATAATRPWSTAACRAPAFRPPRFRAPAFARFDARPPRAASEGTRRPPFDDRRVERAADRRQGRRRVSPPRRGPGRPAPPATRAPLFSTKHPPCNHLPFRSSTFPGLRDRTASSRELTLYCPGGGFS